MDRNMRHGSYSSNVGPRSLPHMMPNGSGKRHSQDSRFNHGDSRHDMRHSGDVRNLDIRHSELRHSEVRHSELRHSDIRHSSDGRHSDIRQSGDVRHSGDVREHMREMRQIDGRPDIRHEGRPDVRQDGRSDGRPEGRQDGRPDGRHGGPSTRLSPPFSNEYNNNNNTNQHDDLINYIYESWTKVTREVEQGSEDTKYYREVALPLQILNFTPFNLDEWWGRRLMQNKRQQNRT